MEVVGRAGEKAVEMEAETAVVVKAEGKGVARMGAVAMEEAQVEKAAATAAATAVAVKEAVVMGVARAAARAAATVAVRAAAVRVVEKAAVARSRPAGARSCRCSSSPA